MLRWGWLIGLVVLLVVTAITVNYWLGPLLSFYGAQTSLIQGLADTIQIVIWTGLGIGGIIALFRRGKKTPDSTKLQQEELGEGTTTTRSIRIDGKAIERYLQYLIERYRYLDFKGMGIVDRVPLRLELRNLFVPLKARIELPAGETWPRELLLAGRRLPESGRENIGEHLSNPQPLTDLLQRSDGLIILGDPGAGKTTFLKYLTLQMATGASIETRLPVLVPLSAYANVLAERDVRLDDFIADYFHDLGLEVPIKQMLRQALEKGGAVVMLDGLDEVKEISRRDNVVRRVVDFYLCHRKAGNKFLLTSRIIGYREVRPTAAGLAECTLVDFDDEEIAAFVGRWTAVIEQAARGESQVASQEADRERQELLLAIQHNSGVRRLAANPLLLTILALMKRQGVRLPERRVELYQKYVETLLSSWNRARGLGRPPARDLDVVETVRILAPLALWMHEVNPGVGLVKQSELMRQLAAIYRERGETNPEGAAKRFLSDVREHTGLLLERGSGQYGFIHLTFEEYLAAMAIAQRGQQSIDPIVKALAGHVQDDNWREVSLLTVGYLGIIQQRDEAAGTVLQRLIRQAPGEPGQAVILAGEAVVDAWPGGVTLACKSVIAQALGNTMKNDTEVNAVLRTRAGDALARLGDSRREASTLADMQFCFVPAGLFWIGDEDETQRALNCNLNYGFWISRYPLTNAQFHEFVRAGGYREASYWSEGKVADVWQDGKVRGWDEDQPREQPFDFGSPFNLPNHPVVGITWYEALAFCRWLTELCQSKGWFDKKSAMLLPSEAEWEKAARGGEEIPEPYIITAISAIPTDTDRDARWDGQRKQNNKPKRHYPWDDTPDPNRANCADTRINTTGAVGCFPSGASPYGCEEMSGNVWEWTRSLWGMDYSEPEYRYPYEPMDGREKLDASDEVLRVVRGGSFAFGSWRVRCAVRQGGYPDFWGRRLGFRLVIRPSP